MALEATASNLLCLLLVPTAQSTHALPPPSLPVETVVALIEFLGDQVADAHDAFELFAERDGPDTLRMSMAGLACALQKLWY